MEETFTGGAECFGAFGEVETDEVISGFAEKAGAGDGGDTNFFS